MRNKKIEELMDRWEEGNMSEQDLSDEMYKLFSVSTKIEQLEKWSQKYEFNFQFWGKSKNNVFIYKNDVEIFCSGDNQTVEDAINKAIEFINKINKQ